MTATQNHPPSTRRPPATAPPVRDGQPLHRGDREGVPLHSRPREIDGIIGRAHAAYLEWRNRPVEERAADRRPGRRADATSAATTSPPSSPRRWASAAGGGRRALPLLEILKYYADNGPGFLEPTADRAVMGKGEAVVENRADRRPARHRAVELPLLPGRPRRRPEPGAGQHRPPQARRDRPAVRAGHRAVFRDAGAPEGVFTNTFLRIADVEQVIADPRIQGVTLTGSERAGSAVAALAGKHLKKSVLELGGSDPFIVLDAEDLGATVKAATMGRMQNTGQACIAAKRLIVTEDIYEPFVEGLKQAFSTFSPGDPADPSTSLAPLSRERAAQDLHAQIQDADRQGRHGRRRRRAARARGRVRRADDPHRRHPGDAGLPRGAVRAGGRRLQGEGRGRGGRAGQQQRLRPRRHRHGQRPRPGPRRWPSGSRPAWCGSTSPPAPPPSCPSAA